MPIDRREFLRTVTVGAGLALTGRELASGQTTSRTAPATTRSPEVVVVGAGAFGLWTALNLQRLGARVTVVDAYGPGNSRSTSGGETRGVRSSYGDRPHGPHWARWAKEAIRRWTLWDQEYQDRLLPRLFFSTGDIILRDEKTP